MGTRATGLARAAPPAADSAGDHALADSADDQAHPVTADPPDGAISAVQPARPRARRPVVRQHPPGTEDGSGDVVCPACATGNPTERRFCRRCGTALGTAPGPAVRVSWWRRLGRALLRAARWLVRPRSGGWGLVRRVGAVLLAAALLAGLGYGAVRLGSRASDAIRDRLADPQPASPVSVSASSHAADHPPELVADGISNSHWAPATGGAGRDEYVELTFADPFRLLDLIIHPGVSAQRDEFLRQARPAELELTAWTSRSSESTTLRLTDQAGPQTFHWVVNDVVRLRLTVRDSYGSAPGRRTAIGEVEVFRRP
ncbi:NADase-type glycan-binding domain-containing protein [Micromonospora sp. NPDC000442]|uniref:NADase-type glycan-binding domain-containing protein n=1 Tax=Micromonospora sp. NPDC000442 TaxID=3364217 RepID=UPI0036BE9E72